MKFYMNMYCDNRANPIEFQGHMSLFVSGSKFTERGKNRSS